MAKVITVANQKGGVGKTSTVTALIMGLSSKGFKTLLIDIDPQGNATFAMAADDTKAGIYDALKAIPDTIDTIQTTSQGDIIASNLLLTGADMEFTATGREYLLRDIIKPIRKDYDYIVIDTPPTLGILTINALTAADDIIITMGADIFSLQGLSQLYKTISKVRQYCNANANIAGLLITRYSNRSILSRELKETIEEAAKQLNTKLFNTIIREGIAVKEAQAQQENLFINAPKSNPAIDYLAFIGEYLEGEQSNG